MKKLILFFLLVIVTQIVKADWFSQSSGTANTLNSVYFPVLNTGYIAGNNGTLLKTIDGGALWIPKISGTNNNLCSVFFINANTGYAVGDYIILKTVNGGNSWTSQNVN